MTTPHEPVLDGLAAVGVSTAYRDRWECIHGEGLQDAGRHRRAATLAETLTDALPTRTVPNSVESVRAVDDDTRLNWCVRRP
jgi:hypothetical protein